MTIKEAKTYIRTTLVPIVGDDEAQAMSTDIIEHIKGLSPVEQVMYGHRELIDGTINKINNVVDKIKAGEPMQYVLGNAWFHGRKFAVSPAVLIPRPETSQLIDLLVDRLAQRCDLRILDIGTGSGCIAVSLALDLPFSTVDAIDISADALMVAQANAMTHNANINCLVADALDLDKSVIANRSYDCIVSNPPYIIDSERSAMDARVYEHEPATALFVPDDDPLKFYRSIARYALTNLNDGGWLFLEINPLCTQMLTEMLSEHFAQVEALRDYKGNYRFIIARKQ